MADLLREVRERPWPVRWVGEAGIHLTLKFYGDVREERIDAVAEAVGFAVEGMGPLGMSLDGLGAFPGWERPHVIWAGVAAPPPLEILQDRIERRADAVGFPAEGAPFRPHVTLGRVREGERLPAGAVTELQGRTLTASFLADRVVLFESRRSGRMPEYVPLRTFELAR